MAFVDTPGHEAFTEMRARGANVTDIAVLVVAADDGVMPQTEEAISHARAAGVPIVVALNKIDLPGVNLDRVYEPTWPPTNCCPANGAAKRKSSRPAPPRATGIDELLETLLTVAELHEYKANPDRPARGTCLEAEMHEDRGVVAKLLVQNGTLRPGDVIVCGGGLRPRQGDVRHARSAQEVRRGRPLDARERHRPERGPRGRRPLLRAAPTSPRPAHLAEQRAAEAARQRDLSGGRAHVTLENLFERLGEERRGADAEHHPAGRRPRLDRGHPQGAGQARSTPRCRSRSCRPPWAASPRPTSTWPTPPTR